MMDDTECSCWGGPDVIWVFGVWEAWTVTQMISWLHT